MKVDGTTLHEASIPPKCEKYLKPLQRKKMIDLDSIGSQKNNNLLDFLRCQSKAKKICADEEKVYSKCHASVMGTGSFKGMKNCGEELEKLFDCTMGR